VLARRAGEHRCGRIARVTSDDDVEFAPGPVDTEEVLFARQGRLGRIRLNRPRAINALTHPMVRSVLAQLRDWAEDDAITAVSIEGSGDRGLCAGGDVRAIRQSVLTGTGDPLAFWADEYALNAAIHHYPKPYVAFMDGVVMGGGVGISAYGSLRLVTERSRVAMPETAIGFFPDVGALHLLSRAPGELGTHLALTGTTVGGADAVVLGLADALVDRADLPAIRARLAEGAGPDVVDAIRREGDAQLPGHRAWIDDCYAGDDPVLVLKALQANASPAAGKAAALLAQRSPMSVAVTLEALRRASGMTTLEQVLAQDLVLGASLMGSSDFLEGVRAVLVDRDHAPRWRHASLEQVRRDEVEDAFRPAYRATAAGNTP
jgi:enoyl-CoA hydratase